MRDLRTTPPVKTYLPRKRRKPQTDAARCAQRGKMAKAFKQLGTLYSGAFALREVEALREAFKQLGTLYSGAFELCEVEALRERLRVEQLPPRSFAVDDFGQLDWGDLLG